MSHLSNFNKLPNIARGIDTTWAIPYKNSKKYPLYDSSHNISHETIISRLLNTEDSSTLTQKILQKYSIKAGIENNGKILNNTLITTQENTEFYNTTHGVVHNFGRIWISKNAFIRNDGKILSYRKIRDDEKIIGNTPNYPEEKFSKKDIDSIINDEIEKSTYRKIDKTQTYETPATVITNGRDKTKEASNSEKYQTLVDEAMTANVSGQHAISLTKFDKILEISLHEPLDNEILTATWFGKGQAHVGLMQFDEAKKCFEKTVLLDPDGRFKQLVNQMMVIFGNIMDDAGSNKNADIRDVIKRHEADLDFDSIISTSKIREEDLLKKLKQSDNVHPLFDEWSDKMNSMSLTDEYAELTNRICKNFEIHNYQEIIRDLEKLLWAFPSNAETRNLLGLLKNKQNRFYR